MPGLTGKRLALTIAVGLAAGFSSGLLGVGGGVILVPGLVALGYSQRDAVAGSLAGIIPISIVGVATYYLASARPHVRLDLGLALVAGSVIGATLGARLAHRVPERALRVGFGVVTILVAARLLVPS